MHITERTVKKTIELIELLLNSNLQKIEKAYCDVDGDLSLSMPIKIKPTEKGHDIEVTLDFVESRVKVKEKGSIDEKQIPLFKTG